MNFNLSVSLTVMCSDSLVRKVEKNLIVLMVTLFELIGFRLCNVILVFQIDIVSLQTATCVYYFR